MVFAPRLIGGMGLCNLQSEMEMQQILILLHHLRAGTPLGQAMVILTCQYQLWVCIWRPILEDTCPCPWVHDQWLSCIHCTMRDYCIQIQYKAWTILELHHNDVCIMEAIEDLELTVLQLEQINACHMYLNITTLAEMTNHMGTTLLPQTLKHPNQHPQGLQEISTLTLEWPQVHCPSKVSWKLWTTTICNLFMGSASGSWLQHSLGAWMAAYQMYRHWNWRMALTGCMLHQSTTMQNPWAAIPMQTQQTQIIFPWPFLWINSFRDPLLLLLTCTITLWNSLLQ